MRINDIVHGVDILFSRHIQTSLFLLLLPFYTLRCIIVREENFGDALRRDVDGEPVDAPPSEDGDAPHARVE